MEPNSSNLFELQIDQQASVYLGETAKWAKFLSIVGFIMCAILLVIGIFAGTMLANMNDSFGGAYAAGYGTAFGMIYAFGALLYFFPCLYLFRFSTAMQTALRSNDQQTLLKSFRNLKSCYKFLGILTLVILILWVLAFVFGSLGSALG